MGKIRDLFKKIRVTKGTFHAKMGTLKDRNGKDLTETEEIKNRWQRGESAKPLAARPEHGQCSPHTATAACSAPPSPPQG